MTNEMAKAREEQYEAMRKDSIELREMLNELLRSLIQYSADRTSLAFSPALQIVLEDIQEVGPCTRSFERFNKNA
jgi:hypothetical protein